LKGEGMDPLEKKYETLWELWSNNGQVELIRKIRSSESDYEGLVLLLTYQNVKPATRFVSYKKRDKIAAIKELEKKLEWLGVNHRSFLKIYAGNKIPGGGEKFV
jgi:hypothetical protein